MLFAANLAEAESNLAPVDSAALTRQLQGSRVKLIDAGALAVAADEGAKAEWWLGLLGMLGLVLGAEQGLAWLFGRRR